MSDFISDKALAIVSFLKAKIDARKSSELVEYLDYCLFSKNLRIVKLKAKPLQWSEVEHTWLNATCDAFAMGLHFSIEQFSRGNVAVLHIKGSPITQSSNHLTLTKAKKYAQDHLDEIINEQIL